MPVVKPDGGVRICGDYKVTVNSTLEVDQHPLPNPEELFVALSGGEKFTKLDLSRAYQQILLEGVCNNQYPQGTNCTRAFPARVQFSSLRLSKYCKQYQCPFAEWMIF